MEAARATERRRRYPVAKVKGGWTPEEDAVLKELVQQYGEGNWSMISRSLNQRFGKSADNGRIGKQCRERWNHHLRPDIKKDAWSEEEETLLVKAHAQYGNRWSDIAKYLPGRTENAVKNHWNATLRRKDSDKHSSGVLKEYMVQINLIAAQRGVAPQPNDVQQSQYQLPQTQLPLRHTFHNTTAHVASWLAEASRPQPFMLSTGLTEGLALAQLQEQMSMLAEAQRARASSSGANAMSLAQQAEAASTSMSQWSAQEIAACLAGTGLPGAAGRPLTPYASLSVAGLEALGLLLAQQRPWLLQNLQQTAPYSDEPHEPSSPTHSPARCDATRAGDKPDQQHSEPEAAPDVQEAKHVAKGKNITVPRLPRSTAEPHMLTATCKALRSTHAAASGSDSAEESVFVGEEEDGEMAAAAAEIMLALKGSLGNPRPEADELAPQAKRVRATV